MGRGQGAQGQAAAGARRIDIDDGYLVQDETTAYGPAKRAYKVYDEGGFYLGGISLHDNLSRSLTGEEFVWFAWNEDHNIVGNAPEREEAAQILLEL